MSDTCEVQAHRDQIATAFTAKYAECGCSDANYLPTNMDDWCGDSGSWLADVYNATNGMIADCGLLEDPTKPSPGAPGDCPITSDYLDSMVSWISALQCSSPSECVLDLVQLFDDAVADQDNLKFAWFETDVWFPAGSYTVWYVEGAFKFPSGAATDVYDMQACYNGDPAFAVGHHIFVLVEDCTGQSLEGVPSGVAPYDTGGYTTLAAVEAARADTTMTIVINAPSKIGFAMMVNSLEETPINDAARSPTFSLTPCVEPCEPQPVVDAGYSVSGGNGTFTWTRLDKCSCEFVILYDKIAGTDDTDLCGDVLVAGDTGYEICEASNPSTVWDTVAKGASTEMRETYNSTKAELAAGVYCGRIDTVYTDDTGDITVEGTPFCFESECNPACSPEVMWSVETVNRHYHQTPCTPAINSVVNFFVRCTRRVVIWGTLDPYVDATPLYVLEPTFTSAWSTVLGATIALPPTAGITQNMYMHAIAEGDCGEQFRTVRGLRYSFDCGVAETPCVDGTDTWIHRWTWVTGMPAEELYAYHLSGGTYDKWAIVNIGTGKNHMSGSINSTSHRLNGLPGTFKPADTIYGTQFELRKCCGSSGKCT